MQDVVLLEILLSALTGERVTLDPSTVTEQKEFDNAKVDGKRVRVDTYAKGTNGCAYSVDMQNTFEGGDECLTKRLWYYAARMFSSQPVSAMHYEELKACNVVFFLPKNTIPEKMTLRLNQQRKRAALSKIT